MQPGDLVTLPEGGTARVLMVDGDEICVQLDGETVGIYPADRLTLVVEGGH